MHPRIAALAAAALIAVPSLSQAQVGVKAGLSFGNVSNSGVLPGDNGQRTGFAIGIGIQSPGPGLGFGLEALYAQRGVQSRELDYIDVPIYLRLEATNDALSPFAYIGPQFSFEISCATDGDIDCPSGRPTTSYAGVIGAGLRFGVRAMSLEARYVYGLSDLELDTVTSSDSYQTRSFLVLLGLGL